MKLSLSARFKLLFIFLTPVLLLAFNNCGLERPRVGTQSLGSSGFNHAGITTGCASCHDTGKYAARFPAVGHIPTGGQDCSSCHNTMAWRGIGTGAGAKFHVQGATPPTQCASCHGSGGSHGSLPAVPIINKMAHAHPGLPDCASCHTANIGVSWAGGVFNHSPKPTSCQDCHDPQRPQIPVGSTNFDHKTAAGGLGDCLNCHTSNIGVMWTNGTYNHTPTPTSCAGCHSSKRPATLIGKMLHTYPGLPDCATCHQTNVGTNWTGGIFSHTPTPNSCSECHTAQRPTALVGTPPFSHPTAGMGDCKSCHTVNIGVNWSGGTFNHTPTPTSCATCHSGRKPTAIINQMNHAYPGLPDCVSCHVAGVGTSWTGGIFSHTPTPASCQECHAAKRPTGPSGATQYDHANGGMGDCKSCHTTNIGTSWSTGTFNHSPTPTSCNSCHTGDKPVSIINKMNHQITGLPDCVGCHASGAGSTWTGGQFSHTPTPTSCSTCHAPDRPAGAVGSPVPFNHGTAPGGTGDCFNCHKTNIGVSWNGGQFSHSPKPTSCATCHASQKPAALVGQMNHNRSGLPDCAVCHTTNVGTSWLGGVFNHVPTPTSCADCHTTRVPPGTVPNTQDGFNHASTYGTECFACHTVVPANIGVSWTKGWFDHLGNNLNAFTNCSPCHDTKKHHAGEKCTNCHTHQPVIWPTKNTSGNYGGSWKP